MSNEVKTVKEPEKKLIIKSKTILFGVALGLIGALSSPDLQVFIGEHIPSISGLIGTVIVILRAITTTAVK